MVSQWAPLGKKLVCVLAPRIFRRRTNALYSALLEAHSRVAHIACLSSRHSTAVAQNVSFAALWCTLLLRFASKRLRLRAAASCCLRLAASTRSYLLPHNSACCVISCVLFHAVVCCCLLLRATACCLHNIVLLPRALHLRDLTRFKYLMIGSVSFFMCFHVLPRVPDVGQHTFRLRFPAVILPAVIVPGSTAVALTQKLSPPSGQHFPRRTRLPLHLTGIESFDIFAFTVTVNQNHVGCHHRCDALFLSFTLRQTRPQVGQEKRSPQ